MALILGKSNSSNNDKKYILFACPVALNANKILVYNINTGGFEVMNDETYNDIKDSIIIHHELKHHNDSRMISYLITDMIDNINLSFNSLLLDNISYDYDAENPLYIPVKVIGGRKHRNAEGLLLYSRTYDNGFGANTYQYIFDFASKSIIRVNSISYLKIDENWITQFNKTIEDIYVDDFSIFDNFINNFCSAKIIGSINERWLHEHTTILERKVIKAMNAKSEVHPDYKAFIEKKNNDFLQKMIESLPGIIDWVKKNTDKNGEEIEALAKHIFHKRNRINYED
jgi:hypothetical protein